MRGSTTPETGMGRSSRAQAEQNRERVVSTACRLFRQHGVENVSITDIMSAASLTPGGFYRHFASKDALVDEAFALAFEQSSEAWEAVLDSRQDTRAGGLDVLVSHYFRQRPAEKSCPILAFSSRTSHLPAASRTVGVYGRGTERLLERFRAEAGHTARPTGAEPDALVLFAAMVGTGLLMRAAGDTPWVRAMQDAVLAALPRPAATDTAGVAP